MRRFKRVKDVSDGRPAFACETSRLDQPQYQNCQINCAEKSKDCKSLIEEFNVSKLFEQPFEENELELIDEGRYSLFIAEDKLKGCPKVKVSIGNEEITSI